MNKAKKKVVCSETESKSLFRFGDGMGNKKFVNITIIIGSKRMLLGADVFKNNFPWSIFQVTMSKMGTKIDFTKHEAEVNCQVVKLQ